MKFIKSKGFTLIELLVVIVIIGILATLTTVALSAAKVKARDAKRISDIKQMQTALELYYNEENTYPPTSALTVGQALVGAQSGKTFMGKIPAGPNTGETYTYNQINGGTSYTLGYTLEKPVNEFAAGAAVALPGNINTQCTPNCTNKCSGEMDSCNKVTCANPSAGSVTVSGIIATADTPRTTITITWDPLLYSNVTYKLEYSQSANGGSTWSAFADVAGATALTTTTYSHTGRTASYQYKYRVTPTICSSVLGIASTESNSSGCVIVATPPATVTLSPNYQQAVVTWTAVSGATQYKVYGNTSGTPTLKYTGSNLYYTETGLTNGSTYYYSVIATVCGVDSSKSTEQSVVPNTNFYATCDSKLSVVATCGGGWLICKPGDGNCANTTPSNFVVVAPADLTPATWANAITACSGYSNAGYSGWSLPKVTSAASSADCTSAPNNLLQFFPTETCQMMRRSNVCGSMNTNSSCGGGCYSVAPITGISTNSYYWSETTYSGYANSACQKSTDSSSPSWMEKIYSSPVRCVKRY